MASSSSPMAVRRLARPDGLVLPGAFRSIPRRIRGRDELADVLDPVPEGSRPKARRDLDQTPLAGLVLERELEPLDALAHALGEVVGALQIRPGQHDRELLAAVAGREVDRARGVLEHA